MSVPNSSETNPVVAMLTEAHKRYQEAKQNRLNAIRNARAAGVTFAQIGAIIGMSEDGVRKMLKRAK